MRGRFYLTEQMRSTKPLVAALAYARAGLKVLTTWGVDEDGNCDCGLKNCKNAGKHPLGEFFPHGHLSATTDPAVLKAAWRAHPNANVAIVPDDDLIALDVDTPEAERALAEVKLPDTLTVRTGRGKHFYFKSSSGSKLELPHGVELKGYGKGAITVPPSRHASGRRYRWLSGVEEAVELVFPERPRKTSVKINFGKSRRTIGEGTRNARLTSMAGVLRNFGLESDDLEAVLLAANDRLCDPSLEADEVAGIARSVARYATPLEEAFGTMSDVVAEAVPWLFQPYLPRGTLTMLEGDPGLGKSTFAAAISAAVTTGRRVPWSKDRCKGKVLIMSAEDDVARILKPRLDANGADNTRVRYARELFTLDEAGVALLRAEIERERPDLVIIDPIVAFLDSDSDLNDAADMTRFLTSLDRVAREFDCALLIVRHLRKLKDGSAINQGLGSIALAGRVRSMLLFARHPHDPNLRAVAHSKSNYAAQGPTIVFALQPDEGGHPVVEWMDVDADISPQDLLSGNVADPGRPPKELHAAMDLLRSLLSKGPTNSREIELAAKAKKVSRATLRRAREELGLRILRSGRQTMWALPGYDDDETDE